MVVVVVVAAGNHGGKDNSSSSRSRRVGNRASEERVAGSSGCTTVITLAQQQQPPLTRHPPVLGGLTTCTLHVGQHARGTGGRTHTQLSTLASVLDKWTHTPARERGIPAQAHKQMCLWMSKHVPITL